MRLFPFVRSAVLVIAALVPVVHAADHVTQLQTDAVRDKTSPLGHWGTDPAKYSNWGSHSNRLVPVYTFGTRGAGQGIDLSDYVGQHSPYRRSEKIRAVYGHVPTNTLNPEAQYLDQSNVGDIQRAALEAGRKYIFLVVFDGMDWQTTRAAAVYNKKKVAYNAGRGTGLHLLDYTAQGTSQFGFMVTAPTVNKAKTDVDSQQVAPADAAVPGGYNADKGGSAPWKTGADVHYLIGKSSTAQPGEHTYVDSAASATAMTTGVKTYNGAINVDSTGQPLATIAHRAQQLGYAVGAVTSVPISHATPAASYAHNVTRNDYQDITRDLLGLPSTAHPDAPLPGLDVLIGAGYGVTKETDKGQGANFAPGNRYIAPADLKRIDVARGGQYVVVQRESGTNGTDRLLAAADRAVDKKTRLFGMFGVSTGHLPFRTADGKYDPAPNVSRDPEAYSEADVQENPKLADLTNAAIRVLSTNTKGFCLMVEAGDVDWANHANNLDTSIGAVLSGDNAVRAITRWVEQHSNWDESLLIVTADHGHYLVLTRPELLIAK